MECAPGAAGESNGNCLGVRWGGRLSKPKSAEGRAKDGLQKPERHTRKKGKDAGGTEGRHKDYNPIGSCWGAVRIIMDYDGEKGYTGAHLNSALPNGVRRMHTSLSAISAPMLTENEKQDKGKATNTGTGWHKGAQERLRKTHCPAPPC